MYLKSTSNVGLICKGDNKFVLIRYSYLIYVGELDVRCSITRYALTISGLLVSWKAILQST